MSGSPELDAVVARWLLVALTPLVLAGPLRWAVVTWLVMTNLDATGSGVAAQASVGWLNAFKAVVLPAWLLVRLRGLREVVPRAWPGWLWLGLAVWACVTALWTPYPLAAVKLGAGMAAMWLGFIALRVTLERGLLNDRTIWWFLLVSIFLGLVQTIGFGDGSFGYAGRGMPQRFTSFVAAQQFAALLAAMVCWALWTPWLAEAHRTAVLAALFAALAANGSRTWTLGTLIALGIYTLVKRPRWLNLARVVVAIVILASVPAIRRGLTHQSPGEPPNRLTATASALIKGEDRADGMGLGTARFRLRMYGGVWEAWRAGAWQQWLLGRGAGSAADVAQRLFPYAYRGASLDPNRVVHNEWLRVLYELGVAGAVLWLGALGGLVRFAWSRRADDTGMALLSYLPAFLLGVSAENVLDGAGNAVTTGLLLLAARAAAAAEVRETRADPS
jgi:O-antigen ligase